MARILMSWEFGSGLGHLTRMMPVARRLRADGHELVVAVPSPREARAAIERSGLAADGPLDEDPKVHVIQGGFWPAPNFPGVREVPTLTLADTIRLFGYQVEADLKKHVANWGALVDKVQPSLIVGDFCPTLVIAAFGRVPIAIVGNGYTVPPAGRALPPTRPWDRSIPDFSVAHEAELLDAINNVRAERGDAPFRFFADCFSGDRTFVCTIPEFDPYGRFRRQQSLVPFNIPAIRAGRPIREREPGRAFLYLPGNHPILKQVLAGIGLLPITVDGYIKGLPGDAQVPSNIRLSDMPLPLPDILPEVTAAIHHAGLATAYAGALAGTPQVALPHNLEHLVTSKGMEKWGASTTVSGRADTTPEQVASEISKAMERKSLHKAAAKTARMLALRRKRDGVETIVSGCRELIG